MRVLVTGGAGFIGSHIVGRLVLEGHQVSVIDNLSTGKSENLNPQAEFYKLDIENPRIEKAIKKEKPEVICHLAAQMDVRRSVADPAFDAKINIIGMINILENAVRCGTRKVIFSSTGGAIYGDGGPYPTTENHKAQPVSPYGISKLTGENYLYYYHVMYGLNYVSLRYANVYGPRQDPFGEAGVVAIFAKKMLRNEQPLINGNGMQTRDYVYVEDVVNAVMLSLENNVNDIFNVGTGIETTVNDLFSLLVELTGSSVREMHGPAKKGEQMRSCLGFDKIRKTLDWEPSVPLRTGLANTVAFFRERQ